MCSFLTHAVHRGTTFFDSFGRRKTRFFPVVAASLPLSLVGAALATRHPRVALASTFAAAGGGVAFALRRRRPLADALAFGALLTPFAVAFSAGIWRGALMAAHPQEHA